MMAWSWGSVRGGWRIWAASAMVKVRPTRHMVPQRGGRGGGLARRGVRGSPATRGPIGRWRGRCSASGASQNALRDRGAHNAGAGEQVVECVAVEVAEEVEQPPAEPLGLGAD